MKDMKKTVIAPVGDANENLFTGMRDFPTRSVVLVTSMKRKKEAEALKDKVEKENIPCTIRLIEGELYEGTFKAVSQITRLEGPDNVIVNVATGDKNTRCAATSAAFVNGLRAIAVEGDNTMLLPVLKFNYYKLLSDKKMSILEKLYHSNKCVASLEDLSKILKMSLPLLSYHINGNLKTKGLKTLGLVETSTTHGRVQVCLSMQGLLLVKGYLPMEENE